MEENNMEALHQEAMKKIENARNIRELPTINKKILLVKLKDHFENEEIENVDYSDMIEIADSLIKGEDINDNLLETLKRLDIEEEDMERIYASLYDGIVQDTSLDLMVEELNAKNEKVAEIYSLRHEEIMKEIDEATILEDLPKNKTTSVLTNYLRANSSIYMDGVSFTASDFAMIANLLLDGKKVEDEEIQNLLKELVNGKYPENSERIFKLLNEKLKELPNTYNLVDEINRKNEKDQEFIGKGLKDVNLYLLPIIDPKAPHQGGKFYASYVSTGKVLGMDRLLPELKEKELYDNREIETYIQTNYDKSFKTSGANILGRGYRIKEVYLGGELKTEEDKENESSGYVTISRKEYESLLAASKERDKYKSFLGTVKEAIAEVEKEENLEVEDDFDTKEEI